MQLRHVNSALLAGLVAAAGMMLVSHTAYAQPEEPAQPEEVPALPGADTPAPVDETELPYVAAEPATPVETTARLTIHVVDTRNTFEVLGLNLFDVNTKQVVAYGNSADEAAGELPLFFDLPPGVYKIVRSGEPFTTHVDFATVHLDGPTDFVIVVDPDTHAFRGSGIVTGELPQGRDIAGIRVALNVGGSLMLNQQSHVVGNTNGINSLLGLFGNFSMVMDRGKHFLRVDSRLSLTIRDPETAGAFSTTDFFQGSALYALNINNPYIGPYARVGFQTKIFPGYLYLESDENVGTVNIHRLDGSTEVWQFGQQANADNIRIKLAEAFAPLVLQEEIGGNLKAVDMDLRLLELNVATRIGFGFRQGISNGLLVVDGDERGSPVELYEVDDYFTLGPVIGANATVTFARWLFGSGEIGIMAPVMNTDDADGGFADRLLIDMSATGGLKFPSLSFFYGSIDYTLRLQRDAYFTSDTQFAHTIMARANLQLF